MHPALLGLTTVILGVSGCLLYFIGSNLILDKLIFPQKKLAIKAETSTPPILSALGYSYSLRLPPLAYT